MPVISMVNPPTMAISGRGSTGPGIFCQRERFRAKPGFRLMMLVVAAGGPHDTGEAASWTLLGEHPFIAMAPRSSVRELTDVVMARANVSAKPLYESPLTSHSPVWMPVLIARPERRAVSFSYRRGGGQRRQRLCGGLRQQHDPERIPGTHCHFQLWLQPWPVRLQSHRAGGTDCGR